MTLGSDLMNHMLSFDQDIAVTQKKPFRFKGCVSDNWSVLNAFSLPVISMAI